MAYPVLLDAFDDHLGSMTPEQLTKAGFSTKAEDLEKLGDAAEQALAMQVCTYLTGKISKPSMASKTEEEIREYCSKNFIKIATEAKSTNEKIHAAVTNEQDWFEAKTKSMADLFMAGKQKEALAVQAEIMERKKPTV